MVTAGSPPDETAYPTSWFEVAEKYRRDQDTQLDLGAVRIHLLFDLAEGAPRPAQFETPPHLRFLEPEARSVVTLAAPFYHYQPARRIVDALREARPQFFEELELPKPDDLIPRLEGFARLAEIARGRLDSLGWSDDGAGMKRRRKAPGRRRHLTLDCARLLWEYLASLPRPIVGSELAGQVYKLLDPVFPGLVTEKGIKDSISRATAHTTQYRTAFAKRRQVTEKST